MIPEKFQTYIDKAWQDHAEELARLNNALEVRAWMDGIIAAHESRVQALAEEASQALPWGPEVEDEQSEA